jgi:hypothetical protein
MATSSAMKSVRRVGVVLLLLLALGYLASTAFYTNVSDSRKMALELHTAVAPLRDLVTELALRQGSLQGISRTLRAPGILSTPYGNANVTLSDTGSIMIRSAQPEISIDLVPTLENTTVKWRCRGMPERDMPLACRSVGKSAVK